MTQFITWGFGTVALALGAAVAVTGPDDATTSFKMTIASKTQTEMAGQKVPFDVDTEFAYTWRRAGNKRTLIYNATGAQVTAQGQQLFKESINRGRITRSDRMGKLDFAFDDAPEPIKKMLGDSFEVPVCEVEVDADGRETKRTTLVREGVQSFIDEGAIANALLFHPPSPDGEESWRFDARHAMGAGKFALGELLYEKESEADGKRVVKVSGELTNDDEKSVGTTKQLNKTRYVVGGEQTYDTARREWVAGTLTLDLNQEVTADGQPVGKTVGTSTLTFEMLPEKK